MPSGNIIEQLVKLITKDSSICGIVRFGVTDREPQKVKLIALVEGDWQKKESFQLGDYLIELEYVQYHLCKHKISEQRNPFFVGVFQKGEILFERNSRVSSLCNLAKEIYLEGPKRLTPREKDGIRANLTKKFIEVSQTVEKFPTTGLLLMSENIQPLLESYFLLNGFWGVKGKFVLFNIRRHDQYLYSLIQNFLHESDLKRKYGLFKEAYQYVLGPHGGLIQDFEAKPKRERKRLINAIYNPLFLFKRVYDRLIGKEGLSADVSKSKYDSVIRFMKSLKPYWQFFMVVSLANLISVLLLVPGPLLTKVLFDNAFPNRNIALIRIILIAIFAILVFRAIFDYVKIYYTTFMKQRIWYDIQTNFYKHLFSLPYQFYDDRETGELVFRFSDAKSSFELSTNILFDLIGYVTLFLAIPLICIFINLKLALLYLVVVPLYIMSYYKFSQYVYAYVQSIVRKKAQLSAKQYESLSVIRIIQALGKENYILRKLKKILLELRKRQVLLEGVIIGGFDSLNKIIGGLGILVVALYAWHQILMGTMSIGDLFAFIFLSFYLYAPIKGILALGPEIQKNLVRTKRFFEIYDQRAQVADEEGAEELKEVKGELVFDRVYFGYELDKPLLKDISVTVSPNTTVALVGATGSGKTSLLNLIPRFYEYTAGEIFLDGKPLRNIKRSSLRKFIGIVPQKDFIFDGSIEDNIKIGRRGATFEEVQAAAKKAKLHDFVMQLKDGYATQVGEGGAKLSGGEIERISIARALIRNPQILLLDEAIAQLDPETEQLVYEAIDGLLGERTTIVIAHRLSTIKKANKVIVLDKGRIVETGTHDELIRNGGVYQRLFEEQAMI